MNRTDTPLLSRQNQILDVILFNYLGNEARNDDFCSRILLPVKKIFSSGRDLTLLLWAEGSTKRGNTSENQLNEIISNSAYTLPEGIKEGNLYYALRDIRSFGSFVGEKIYDYAVERSEEFSRGEYNIDGMTLRPSYEKLLDEFVVLLRSQSDKLLEKYGISEGAFFIREIPPFRGLKMYFEAPPAHQEWLGFKGGVSVINERKYNLVSSAN